jgi:hypothetical protein
MATSGTEALLSVLVSTLTLFALAWRGLRRLARVAGRLEDAVPTLSGIAEDFPGDQLARLVADLEHALDLQSQVLARSTTDLRRVEAKFDVAITELWTALAGQGIDRRHTMKP